jgi:predicted RNase H-like HicB family nuclease
MEAPVMKKVANGWHAESAVSNLAVRGATPDEAKRRFKEAIEKAAELRSRPAARFANPS